jgi:putative membrane protein
MNEKPVRKTPEKGSGIEHSVSTDLAMDRTYLADERTLMAWIRTSLSMISFGFTIGKLGQVLHDVEFKGLLGNTRTVGVKSLAYFLVVLGTVALLGAALQHWRRLRELHTMGHGHQFSITFIVALVLAAVGGFALTSLVLAL